MMGTYKRCSFSNKMSEMTPSFHADVPLCPRCASWMAVGLSSDQEARTPLRRRDPLRQLNREADEFYYMKNSEHNKVTAAKSSMAVITTSRVEADTATSMEIDLG
eukprot:1130302-Amphidinium_carterae.1